MSSLNCKPINDEIKKHEVTDREWEFQGYAEEYYKWMELFNQEFFEGKLPTAVLSFERTRVTTLGHYHTDKNGIGIEDNINLNSLHLCREKWQILSTLLHEMVHQWQRRLGSFSTKENPSKGNYHNREFLDMTEGFGLIHNKKGQRVAPPKGRFVEFLAKHDVEITEETHYERKKTTSKLKKYSCACNPPVNIRVAREEFSARCNECGEDFELAC